MNYKTSGIKTPCKNTNNFCGFTCTRQQKCGLRIQSRFGNTICFEVTFDVLAAFNTLVASWAFWICTANTANILRVSTGRHYVALNGERRWQKCLKNSPIYLMPINVKQKQAKSANPFFFGFISDTEMNMYTGETPVNYSI